MNGRFAVTLGALWMTVAVTLGAFGAHLLKDKLELLESSATWETAVRYQAWHALGLILLGVLTRRGSLAGRGSSVGAMLLAGSLLFSGSLYVLALEPSATWLGPVTPIGGLLLMAGWLAFARLALTDEHPS